MSQLYQRRCAGVVVGRDPASRRIAAPAGRSPSSATAPAGCRSGGAFGGRSACGSQPRSTSIMRPSSSAQRRDQPGARARPSTASDRRRRPPRADSVPRAASRRKSSAWRRGLAEAAWAAAASCGLAHARSGLPSRPAAAAARCPGHQDTKAEQASTRSARRRGRKRATGVSQRRTHGGDAGIEARSARP